MAERKMRGGMNPSEMAKLRWKQQREREAEQKADLKKEIPIEDLPRHKLIQVLRSPATSSRDLITAAKALEEIGYEDPEDGWKSSAQVRPDYTPPTWDEVLRVAKEAGAV